jgi:hypothetical protein
VGALEQAVRGLDVRREALAARLQEVYQALGIQAPGVTPAHFAEAVISAAGG